MEFWQHLAQIVSNNPAPTAQIARDAGFTPKELYDMLHGRKTIKADYLPEIAEALQTDMNGIFKGYKKEK